MEYQNCYWKLKFPQHLETTISRRVWRSHQAKKDRQCNVQIKKDKNTTQKAKDWVIRTPLKRLLYSLYTMILGCFFNGIICKIRTEIKTLQILTYFTVWLEKRSKTEYLAMLLLKWSSSSSSSSSSNLGTGFTRECIWFRENFAQCRATQQSSTDYLQVKLYTGGRWSSCCQDAPESLYCVGRSCIRWQLVPGTPWWSWGRTNYRRPHCSFFLDKGNLCL